MEIEMTAELGRQMLARKLLERFATERGFSGQANWVHWNFHDAWLSLPKETRGSFWDYVIQTLSR
jgi:hypothetical protein